MFEWIENTRAALWVGESLWGYPIMLGLHVVGLAVVVGIFVMRDLRLLGFMPGIDYVSLSSLQRLGWIGFVVNAFSGAFLFASQAATFVESTSFLLKIAMIFLAVVCAAVIQNQIRNVASSWDNGNTIPSSIRYISTISIFLWAGAIVSGRLIAYL